MLADHEILPNGLRNQTPHIFAVLRVNGLILRLGFPSRARITKLRHLYNGCECAYDFPAADCAQYMKNKLTLSSISKKFAI